MLVHLSILCFIRRASVQIALFIFLNFILLLEIEGLYASFFPMSLNAILVLKILISNLRSIRWMTLRSFPKARDSILSCLYLMK